MGKFKVFYFFILFIFFFNFKASLDLVDDKYLMTTQICYFNSSSKRNQTITYFIINKIDCVLLNFAILKIL